jgi:hypothetical protein
MPLLRWMMVAGVVGCTPPPPVPVLDDFEDPGGPRFELDPPVVGQGTSVSVELVSRRSDLAFEGTELTLEGDGLSLTDFAVLDGFTAIAELTVSDDAPLGERDGLLRVGNLEYPLDGVLEVIAEHFTITPDNAKMGEVIDVVLLGHETAWVPEVTWASFGTDVQTLSVDVLSPTELHARIAIRADAAPGFRDITVEQGADVLTLYGGLTVDRAVLTASFDPPVVSQGDTVDFVVQGVNTRFGEDFLQEQLQFWNRGTQVGDFLIESFQRTGPAELRGVMRVSNAANPGFRDVFIDDDEDLLIGDAIQILAVAPDPIDAVMGLGFDVRRTIDPVTGIAADEVSAFAYFVIPMNFSCGPPFPPASGPVPFDINGVFPVPPPPDSVDCPEPLTVSAGDFMWFESDENTVVLHKDVSGATGQIIYRGRDLTLDDYRFGQVYDVRTQGDPEGIPAFVIDDAQPTVPRDYRFTAPVFANLVHDRFTDLQLGWTPAGVYPVGLFSISVSGSLLSSGEPGFVGVLPFDDGQHVFGPGVLTQLDAGPVSFGAISAVEGRVFELPINGRLHQSDSSLVTSASLTLE